MKTEQLVRKCFCGLCDIPDKGGLDESCKYCHRWRTYSRAARKFVRMENEQKHEKHLMVIHAILKQRHGRLEGPVVLPKHFGEMRFKAACRKTRRAGK